MANNDDPSYLTVGTEVSAKYRGAFCEATIKIAKKLVKCKVSYSKGHSAMVSDDCIHGTLKVGAQVDVTQPDGQVLAANITKLTDQSTYTVVFDDGDERTLKRSSLCLKGGRHFDKSESLDHLPLTDPETFGAPAVLPKKLGRRRARLNYGGDDEEEEERVPRKQYSYPPEFPVGKTVFLENDRRRAGWLPAVIVPAHYVLEESDMKPNTICLRSFKDGRFFAATKNELHEFSPDKEPLYSMLEGDIQPMYMCKPAIERAMAYLDTGELPWGMDLFDGQPEKQGRRDGGVGNANVVTTNSTTKSEVSEQNEEVDRNSFMEKLKKYHENKGTPLTRTPVLAQKDLDLYRLYQLVQENGGMDRVTQEMKWRSLYLQLGMNLSTNASHALKQAYRKHLLGFETHMKGRGRTAGPKESPGRGRKRPTLPPLPETSEEERSTPSDKVQRMSTPEEVDPIKTEPVEVAKQRTNCILKPATLKEDSLRGIKPPAQDPPSSLFPLTTLSPSTTSPGRSLTREVGAGRDMRSSPRSHGNLRELRGVELTDDVGMREEKAESPPSLMAECKSEMSDRESSQGDTTSSTTGEEGEEGGGDTWVKREGQRFAENDRVLVWYGSGKNLQTYEAKIIGTEETENKRDFLVHYSGWNNRYNEWIEEGRIFKKVTNPTKHARPPYKKKKGKTPARLERKLMKDTGRRGGGRGGLAEHLFAQLTTGEERVPPSTLTPAPLETNEVMGSMPHRRPGPPVRPRPPSAKRRRFSSSDHLPSQDSSPSPPSSTQPSHISSPHTTPDARHSFPSSPPSPPNSHTVTPSTITTNHTFTTVTQTLVPNSVVNGSCEVEIGMGCAIEVKREVNSSWVLPRPEDTHTNSLLCPERLSSGNVRLKLLPCKDTKSSDAEQSLSSGGTSATNSESTESSTDEESKSPLPPLLSPIPSPSPPQDVWTSPPRTSTRMEPPLGLFEEADKDEEVEEDEEEEEEEVRGTGTGEGDVCTGESGEGEGGGCDDGIVEEEEEEEDGKVRTEIEKSADEKSSPSPSEKESSPVCPAGTEAQQPSSGGSGECGGCPVTVGEKRKRVRETGEDYEMRRLARRESLKYVIDFSSKPELKCGERVRLIEEHIRRIQQKWSDLKSEVAHLDKRRRRARRKEREAARILAQAHQFHQSSTSQTASTVECH